jgi:hypothetical protein
MERQARFPRLEPVQKTHWNEVPRFLSLVGKSPLSEVQMGGRDTVPGRLYGALSWVTPWLLLKWWSVYRNGPLKRPHQSWTRNTPSRTLGVLGCCARAQCTLP